MPVTTTKTSPNATLLKALETAGKGLSLGRPVQSFNSYITSYKPSLLPTIKNRKELFKTYCLNKKAGHYINFGLRAAVSALVKVTSVKSSPLVTTHITIDFNQEFTDKIIKGSSKKSSAQYFNHLFKSKIAKPIGIEDYFFVFEESAIGLLHVHIVCNIPENSKNHIKDKLWASKWLSFDASGGICKTSVFISSRYKVRINRNALTDSEADLLDMEIEEDPTFSFWECKQINTDDDGKDYCAVYKAKEFSLINVGLADYLCKAVSDKLFNGGKNFGMSLSLKKKMKPFITQVIDEGLKATKSSSK